MCTATLALLRKVLIFKNVIDMSYCISLPGHKNSLYDEDSEKLQKFYCKVDLKNSVDYIIKLAYSVFRISLYLFYI